MEVLVTAEITLEAILYPSEDVVAREIEGELILVPLTAGIGDMEDELYSLNPSGFAIWQKLDGQRSLGEVVAALAEEYDASRTALEADVLGFAVELTRRGILVVK
jgi:hypothetical protein